MSSEDIRTDDRRGTPFAPHTPAETSAMLETLGVDTEADLFDIPPEVAFDGDFDIRSRSEREVLQEVGSLFDRNDDLTEFLGRGHYTHYVPTVVDNLSARSEFLTSYTQYQPEITQGFLQALFEYQSILVELTGLPVANCSMYDAATALAEAALLADRVRDATGSTVLVPDHLRAEKRSVLENYVDGAGLSVKSYPMDDGTADTATLSDRADETTVMVYTESPTVRGVIEESLTELRGIASANDALFCLGTDPVALALLEEPAGVGVDVVVGEAGVLGLPAAYGMGLGLFATRDDYLRQVPGRLVGASEDASDRRAFTLTLQTREQHIRKERATSNICTNQAWVALRAAMHAASLGPKGLTDLAERCVRESAALARRLDAIDGIQAPVHDRHHFREFVADVSGTGIEAGSIADDLRARGFVVHTLDDEYVQVCVTETTAHESDALVAAIREVTG